MCTLTHDLSWKPDGSEDRALQGHRNGGTEGSSSEGPTGPQNSPLRTRTRGGQGKLPMNHCCFKNRKAELLLSKYRPRSLSNPRSARLL